MLDQRIVDRLRPVPAEHFETVVSGCRCTPQLLVIETRVTHDELAARINQARAETPGDGQLAQRGRTPITPNVGKIKNQADVTAGETINRLPIIAHTEQGKIPLFAQRPNQPVAWQRHILILVNQHIFVAMPVIARTDGVGRTSDHAGKVDTPVIAQVAHIRAIDRIKQVKEHPITAGMFAAALLVEPAQRFNIKVLRAHMRDNGFRGGGQLVDERFGVGGLLGTSVLAVSGLLSLLPGLLRGFTDA